MMGALSSRQQRLVALALVAVCACAVWYGVVGPTIDAIESHTEARRAALRALGRDRALVAQAPALRTALASVEQSARWSRLFENQKPDRATLQIESDLRDLFNAPNTLTAMTAQPAVAQGALTRLGVRVSLSLSLGQWTEALAKLQQHPRLLQLESVTIQAPDFQVLDTNPTLTIQAEVVGFMAAASSRRR
jgi:Tfp pilus assembly protein PilO